ncbi:hypothetical protein GCM10010195_44850 [Kitasatospora griseola]|nr:hypothetical protein GCM10010195_44850 [Kitasatospora griseola]
MDSDEGASGVLGGEGDKIVPSCAELDGHVAHGSPHIFQSYRHIDDYCTIRPPVVTARRPESAAVEHPDESGKVGGTGRVGRQRDIRVGRLVQAGVEVGLRAAVRPYRSRPAFA